MSRYDTGKLRNIAYSSDFRRRTLKLPMPGKGNPIILPQKHSKNNNKLTLEHYTLLAIIGTIAGFILAGSILGNIFLMPW